MHNQVAFKARAAGAALNPGPKEQPYMKRKWGFTLVELLVVIAIISILAAIVVPRVQGYILRARMTKAFSEVGNIETALTKMLTDANKDSFRDFFTNPPAPPFDDVNGTVDETELKRQINEYTTAFYQLLRQGKKADLSATGLVLDETVRGKLGVSYLDIGFDPWDNKYQFWVGPYSGSVRVPMLFRSFRPGTENPDGTYTPWTYDEATRASLEAQLPGNPREDQADIPNVYPLDGYPAPRAEQVYIFSLGVNKRSDQEFIAPAPGGLGNPEDAQHQGGGDDINSWDKNEQGWTGFYS